MSAFFTNEQVSLEKQVNVQENPHQIEGELEEIFEIDRCVQWVRTNNYKRVCLQFPDHLLPHSVEVCFKLQEALDQPVYLMGDTAYESCCLDFITAAHVNADAIIHYGSICFSKNANKLPYLNVYEKFRMDLEDFQKALRKFVSEIEDHCTLLIDTPYVYKIDEIRRVCNRFENVEIRALDEIIDYSRSGVYVYIGNNHRKLENIVFSLNEKLLHQYDPTSGSSSISKFNENPVVLKRRYFLAEKIKDARTFGIVMGTLAVENYMKILGRIKKLLKLNHKKYYVISVGKISVAKLANFPEMDVYVVISCAMNEVYDSKEFYKPIVTPCDVEKALNPDSGGLKFSYDFNAYLDKVKSEEDLEGITEPDVSLLTGNLRVNSSENAVSEEQSVEVALRSSGALVEKSAFGAGYLAEKSWKGLEQNLGKTEVKMAKDGRSGLAQHYANETEEN